MTAAIWRWEAEGPTREVSWDGHSASLTVEVDDEAVLTSGVDPAAATGRCPPPQRASLERVLADPERLWRETTAVLHQLQDARLAVGDLGLAGIHVAMDGRVGVFGEGEDPEHGFGVTFGRDGRILRHGGRESGWLLAPLDLPLPREPALVAERVTWEECLALCEDFATEARVGAARAGDEARTTLEVAIDRGDLESVHEQVVRLRHPVPRRTVVRALRHDHAVMKQLVRILKGARVPALADPSLLDEVEGDEARAWLKHALRL